MPTPGLLEKARLYVRRYFSKHMPRHMVFHDLEHTLSVARWAVEIGRASGLQGDQLLCLELAALFHDTGYATTYEGHEQAGAAHAEKWLAAKGVGHAAITEITALILATRRGTRPRNLAQRVLQDADTCTAGQAGFLDRSARLHAEREAVLGQTVPAAQQLLHSLTFLEDHRFHTAYARQRFGKQKAINLGQLRQLHSHGLRQLPAGAANGPLPFTDRELSWLHFNARVLQEARDVTVPLLERLKFVAIHSGNMEEFYRVRVAQLRALGKLGKRNRSALEIPPGKHLGRINQEALRQQAEAEQLYGSDLMPALRQHGIRILRPGLLSADQRAYVLAYFRRTVAPLLHVAGLDGSTDLFVADRQLSLVIALSRTKGKDRLVLVNVPVDELGRFLLLPAQEQRTDMIFLDDVVRAGAADLFKGWAIKACHAIQISRDAELYLDEEYSDDVVLRVRRSLRKRNTGVPVRFIYDRALPRRMLGQVQQALGVGQHESFAGGRYPNLNDLLQLPVEGRGTLRDEPLPPLDHPLLNKRLAARRPLRHDLLLHFPYHSFSAIVQLLQQAATDPAVKRIAITLYRVADRSLICAALADAARRGKRVDVVMEVLARFDERNNLHWGAALARAGAHVSYGVAGYKVHGKLLLIERKKGSGQGREAYLGTGNFNEDTACTYADLGLLTTRKTITAEVARIFEQLLQGYPPQRTKWLATSPDHLRSCLEAAVDREIEHALNGKPASVLLKLNSLEDKPLIRKLYDASRAGVRVRLIVRGICCLVPGVRGHSSRIEAISIVDRYLEHARAYVFHNQGDPLVYLSSADWMQRNMDRRIEVAFPVLDAGLKAEVLRFLELQWRDTAKARQIDAGLTNAYRMPVRGKARVRYQTEWYKCLAGQGA